jgi:hypothetical protein
MSEKGMLMSGPNVLALLDKRKFRAMWLMKQQPIIDYNLQHITFFKKGHSITTSYPRLFQPELPISIQMLAPYQVGDRCYVRETYRTCCPDKKTKHHIAYRATQDSPNEKYRPSIHMPKYAARIWFTITKVTVQRPQDLSHDDCIAEGISKDVCDVYEAWKQLYISVYGLEKWKANKWHFVYWWDEIEVKP